MKKLIIAACALAFTAAVHAATYNWMVSTYACSSGEDPIGIDSLVYFFDGANGSYTASQMTALLSTDSDWKTKVGAAAKIGTTVAEAAADNLISASGTIDSLASNENLVNGYMVLFNAATLADATSFYVADFGGDHTVTSAEKNSKIFFTSAETFAVGNPSNWTAAAPEPTSGLLMLIGLAGLALKRKRA